MRLKELILQVSTKRLNCPLNPLVGQTNNKLHIFKKIRRNPTPVLKLQGLRYDRKPLGNIQSYRMAVQIHISFRVH
jgi:hypothetical protein